MLKLQYFGHLIQRTDSLEKIRFWKDWGLEKKRATEDEMVGWHHLLNGHVKVKVKSLSCVWLFATPWMLVYQAPPSIFGILKVRILEWVAISFSRGIFPTQGSNLGLLHCRQILLLSEPPGKIPGDSEGQGSLACCMQFMGVTNSQTWLSTGQQQQIRLPSPTSNFTCKPLGRRFSKFIISLFKW